MRTGNSCGFRNDPVRTSGLLVGNRSSPTVGHCIHIARQGNDDWYLYPGTPLSIVYVSQSLTRS